MCCASIWKASTPLACIPYFIDETCWFLAVDFDKKSWKEDVAAFLETCRPKWAYLRCWNGLAPEMAATSGSSLGARFPLQWCGKLGSLILTRTMDRRHQLGMDSYDRFFPNQDTMPKGGFGNLIGLPPCSGCHARTTTACLWTQISGRIPINGSFSRGFRGWPKILLKLWYARGPCAPWRCNWSEDQLDR